MPQKIFCKECNEWRDPDPLASPEKVMELVALNLCWDCEFWHRLVLLKSDPNSVRIGVKHYWLGPELSFSELPPHWRGMGGGLVIIRFHDGREVRSTNFWYQGEIPIRWRERLPANAEFVKQTREKHGS